MALAGIYFVVYACKTFLRVHGGCDGAGGGLGGWHGGMEAGAWAWRRHGARLAAMAALALNGRPLILPF